MKREHLFRGKRLDNGEWIEGSRVWNKFQSFIIPTNTGFDVDYYGSLVCEVSKEVNPGTIGQYIGAVDKNGKQIFDGDIDKSGLVVGWNQLHFCFGLFDVNGGFKKELLCSQYKTMTEMYNRWTIATIEVIGNIYDNPELLNQPKG